MGIIAAPKWRAMCLFIWAWIFFCFLFLKISKAVCIMCFHPCSKFCFLCVRGRRQRMKLLNQDTEKKKHNWGLNEEPESQDLASAADFTMELPCYAAQLTWSWEDAGLCTLHNGDRVLLRVISVWLYLPAQTDFGFHLVALCRTVWKWWHSRLSVPHMTEFTGMVPLSLTTQMSYWWGSFEPSSFPQSSVERNRHILAKTANKRWPKSAWFFFLLIPK